MSEEEQGFGHGQPIADEGTGDWPISVLGAFYSSWAGQDQPTRLTIGSYRLELTCSACPEQYNVFLGDNQVGYLRLRHGGFTAETPDCGGKLLFELSPAGDGIFEPEERLPYLTRAIKAIHAALHQDQGQ